MTEQTLLNLISRSLWKDEQPTEIPSEVASEAEHQAVAGLILKTSYQQIAYYIRYTYEEQELIRLLESHGIPLVILKGAAAAVYYPVPSRRSFGDIDFLVSPERFARATGCWRKTGTLEVKTMKGISPTARAAFILNCTVDTPMRTST